MQPCWAVTEGEECFGVYRVRGAAERRQRELLALNVAWLNPVLVQPVEDIDYRYDVAMRRAWHRAFQGHFGGCK